MKRLFFNVAGPCVPGSHYMIDGSRRLGKEVHALIDDAQYFVIHAARQSGKTTLLQDLVRNLHGGDYYALYCSLENAQGLIDPRDGIPTIVNCLRRSITAAALPQAAEFMRNFNAADFAGALQETLADFCRLLDKPLVIFFDEADCLSEQTLILFLRQLRNGYINRGMVPFVHSLALVGLRNIRDFKAHVRPDSDTLGGASPFNIATKALTLRNFTEDEVGELYAQHTAAVGQIFTPDAIARVYQQTLGQPWLINAIARECVQEICERDYSRTIDYAMIEKAILTLILRRDVHFDSLLERLKETRVRNIIEPLILGDDVIDRNSPDYLYVRDLGLIREASRGQVFPGNPIYAEMIGRALSWNTQADLLRDQPDCEPPRYLKNGKLDIDFLLRDFQQFWRENSEIWVERYFYKEAAPHLILQAFLQRVVNGGGEIIREMAIGAKREDLCLVYDGHKYPIELKIYRNKNTYAEGLKQTADYMDKFGVNDGWLVVFNRAPKKSWRDKIFMRREIYDGKNITVAGM